MLSGVSSRRLTCGKRKPWSGRTYRIFAIFTPFMFVARHVFCPLSKRNKWNRRKREVIGWLVLMRGYTTTMLAITHSRNGNRPRASPNYGEQEATLCLLCMSCHTLCGWFTCMMESTLPNYHLVVSHDPGATAMETRKQRGHKLTGCLTPYTPPAASAVCCLVFCNISLCIMIVVNMLFRGHV